AALKESITFCQTSPSEAASQLQCCRTIGSAAKRCRVKRLEAAVAPAIAAADFRNLRRGGSGAPPLRVCLPITPLPCFFVVVRLFAVMRASTLPRAAAHPPRRAGQSLRRVGREYAGHT